MKKTILIVLAVLAAIVAVFAVVVAMQPAEFHIQRSAKMAASPETIFEQVNDFHNWDAWSPWAKLDPNMKQTYSGEPKGKGAVYEWAGNGDVGEGRMTITDSQPNHWVELKLEFLKPFAATNTSMFAFKPDGEETVVTWKMDGKNDFMMKAVCMFMDMDQVVGADFEKGLAQMKATVETDENDPGADAEDQSGEE